MSDDDELVALRKNFFAAFRDFCRDARGGYDERAAEVLWRHFVKSAIGKGYLCCPSF
jgi:hypothetical protein